mmetsp:Transcript_22235/g.34906  ORF Transcript_22235/g.34906 Transcript_22235/m.34906 type:complete len:80 (+) Transcript_22235:485-724(+)
MSSYKLHNIPVNSSTFLTPSNVSFKKSPFLEMRSTNMFNGVESSMPCLNWFAGYAWGNREIGAVMYEVEEEVEEEGCWT